MSNIQPPKRKAPPVPKFDIQDKKIKQDQTKSEYEKFLQETSNLEQQKKLQMINNFERPPVMRETIISEKRPTSPRRNPFSDKDMKPEIQNELKPSKNDKTDVKKPSKLNLNNLNSKLAKINNLYAEKIIKTDKNQEQQTKIQQSVQITEKSLFLIDREEYDPARPNDYEEIKMQMEKAKRGQKSLNDPQPKQNQKKIVEEKKPQHKPQQQQEEKMDVEHQYQSRELKAVNIMEKLGYKFGQGLGKDGKGMLAPIIHQKTGDNQAILTQSTGDLTSILPMEIVVKKLTKQQGLIPSKILLLVNLVGSDEVDDDDLQPEVVEECQKYGKVVNSVIYIMPDHVPENLKVRIFMEYEKEIEAMYAYQNLHGRFFGNRVVQTAFYKENEYYNDNFECEVQFRPIEDVFDNQ